LPYNASLKPLEAFKKAIENVISGGNASKPVGNSPKPAETGSQATQPRDPSASASSSTFANNLEHVKTLGMASKVRVLRQNVDCQIVTIRTYLCMYLT
jgi:hypothetical protein